jgi:hypothetical protein
MSMTKPVIKFPLTRYSEIPYWFDFHDARNWLKKLSKGLCLAFLEDRYISMDTGLNVLIGIPLGNAPGVLGYCDSNRDPDRYTISVSPGVLSLDELVSTVLHELIHAYGHVYGHKADFIEEARDVGLLYTNNGPDQLSPQAKEMFAPLMKMIGPPPVGLVTNTPRSLIERVSRTWAKSSTIYCPTCYWHAIRFFSNLHLKRRCPTCDAVGLYEITNPISMISPLLSSDIPLSSVWSGDISPYPDVQQNQIVSQRICKTTTLGLSRRITIDRRKAVMNFHRILTGPENIFGEKEHLEIESGVGTTKGWNIQKIDKKSIVFSTINPDVGLIVTPAVPEQLDQFSKLAESENSITELIHDLFTNRAYRGFFTVSMSTSLGQF